MKTTNESGQNNLYPKETPLLIMDTDNKVFTDAAEVANGRWAMIGFWLAVGTYAVTGDIIPGLF